MIQQLLRSSRADREDIKRPLAQVRRRIDCLRQVQLESGRIGLRVDADARLNHRLPLTHTRRGGVKVKGCHAHQARSWAVDVSDHEE